MDFKNNQKGFSLVEMLVVIGIISIMAGISLRIVGYLSVANSEKTVQSIQKACNKLQAVSMSKTTKTYLYIYQTDGEYYYTFSTNNCASYSSSVMKKDGDAIGKGLTIYAVSGGADTEISGTTFIKVAYKKDGTFDSANTNCDAIKIVSKTTSELNLIHDTGKVIIK